MIGTLETKQKQLENGFYEFGSGMTKVLILGTCRSIAYLNYLHRWNEGRNEFTVRFIDAFNWNWDKDDNFVDCGEAINALEGSMAIRSMLEETDVFLHEHYANYGMWNTRQDASKNIYQFGMNPSIEVCIPNFHDVFILENDFKAFGHIPDNYIEKGEDAVSGFIRQCHLTSFPEFGDIFRNTWRSVRYFWTPNHISSKFSIAIFSLMNQEFLKMPLTDEFWEGARSEDLFKTPCTEVTQRDIEGYQLAWK